jgi:hypothetical protein
MQVVVPSARAAALQGTALTVFVETPSGGATLSKPGPVSISGNGTAPRAGAEAPSRGGRLRHQNELRNELLAPRLRAEQQGDDEDDGGAARRDQHRDGEAERLIGGKVSQHWAGEACPDCPLLVAEARCGRPHLGRKSFRQIARVLPVDCAEESTLHDEGAGHDGVGISEQIERRHELAKVES